MHNDSSKGPLSKELLKGVLDLLVLRVIAEGPKHGYRIIKAIADLTEGLLEIQDGTLYPILHRLEQRGLIAGAWVESEQARKRKEYRMTPDGRAALDEQVAQGRSLLRILTQITRD